MSERTDRRTLADLVEFARAEVISGDIEPWAATIGALGLGREDALWVLSLYNCTDDMLSTLTIAEAAPSPHHWARPAGRAYAAPIAAGAYLSGERRNLRGGRICKRLDSYAELLAGGTQHEWIAEALITLDPVLNFESLMRHLRHVWGVGRLSAFEWAEFLAKIGGYRIETDDGALWESSGPRESLQRIFNSGEPATSDNQLTTWAYACKDILAAEGVPLSWWDFETVICDFNVMRKGRYYPGKHLAMLREEIDGLPEQWRAKVLAAYRSVIPEGWRDLAGGVDKVMARTYRETGKIVTPRLEAAA